MLVRKQGFLSFDIQTGQVKDFSDFQKNGVSFAEIILYGDSLLLLSDRGVWMKSRTNDDVPHYLSSGIAETMRGGVAMFMDELSRLC